MQSQPPDHAELPAPDLDELRAFVRASIPWLAAGDVRFLADGWDHWSYVAGSHVLRLPKRRVHLGELADDRPLLTALAPVLPLPIPAFEGRYAGGPNGLSVGVYALVPGVQVRGLTRPAAPGFGANLGRFIKALHAFPVAQAAALGVSTHAAADARRNQIGRASCRERV